VFIHNDADIEENLKIIAGLMIILPPHLRAHLTFSTDEYAERPYWRRITFAHNNWADVTIDWQTASPEHPSHASVHPLAAGLGRVLATEGIGSLLGEIRRPEYRRLSFDVPRSAGCIRA
jgi:hypothetical protein